MLQYFLGNSFVSQAKPFIYAGLEGTNPDLRLHDFDISWFGYGGLMLDKLQCKTYKLKLCSPEFVMLDMVTNDLSWEDACPTDLARQVHAWMCGFSL